MGPERDGDTSPPMPAPRYAGKAKPRLFICRFGTAQVNLRPLVCEIFEEERSLVTRLPMPLSLRVCAMDVLCQFIEVASKFHPCLCASKICRSSREISDYPTMARSKTEGLNGISCKRPTQHCSIVETTFGDSGQS